MTLALDRVYLSTGINWIPDRKLVEARAAVPWNGDFGTPRGAPRKQRSIRSTCPSSPATTLPWNPSRIVRAERLGLELRWPVRVYTVGAACCASLLLISNYLALLSLSRLDPCQPKGPDFAPQVIAVFFGGLATLADFLSVFILQTFVEFVKG